MSLSMAWQITTQEGARPTGLGNDIVSGLLHQPANPAHVHAHKLTLPLHEFARDKDGVHVAGVHAQYDSTVHIVHWHHVDSIHLQHDDIGLFARRQRADFAIEAVVFRTFYGGAFDDITHREQGRQVLFPGPLPGQKLHALQGEDRTHLREEITRDLCLNVGTQA